MTKAGVFLIFTLSIPCSANPNGKNDPFNTKTVQTLTRGQEHLLGALRAPSCKQVEAQIKSRKEFFDKDVINFTRECQLIEATTKKWVVLVNVHSEAELNLTSGFVPGARTLNWAVPLDSAIAWKKLGDPLNSSALPKDWSNNQYRKQVTFVLVPPGSEMEFMIGIAAPQDKGKDERKGGGVQMRLASIPTHTITLEAPLLTKQDLASSKEEKHINIRDTLKHALETHHRELPNSIIPEHLFDRSTNNPMDIANQLAKGNVNYNVHKTKHCPTPTQ